ncbi:hypothetical protein [Alistipes putredinis]|jgi:hypothetical protein|uniref:hypothetical protein n=1 Tax=Alistipes putredinis TaxID=28117 RepID=UPI003AB32878
MIRLTNEDYYQLAMLVEDKSCEYPGDFCATIKYNTDRFYSNLNISVMIYEGRFKEPRLFIVSADLKTYLPEGEVANDFDLMRLKNDPYLS